MNLVLHFAFTLLLGLVDCSLPCSKYEFPCENGECVGAELWCDTHKDCSDGSDEKYCKKAGFLNSNPNKCAKTYFKCKDGPCIPAVGRCDGYDNCADSSDENDCVHKVESSSDENTTPYIRTMTSVAEENVTSTASFLTTYHAMIQVDYSNETRLSDSPGVSQREIQFVSSNFKPLDYSRQREMARSWLLSQRRADFGWGDETPRALTSLYLSDIQTSRKRNESDMLMIKQLEVQLSLDMARNSSKTLKLTDLALYINALMASCRDPKNFYGEDLVQILRSRVDTAQRQATFVNPAVYLTLCLSNATKYEDARKLHELFLSRNTTINRIDIQALLLLSSTCMFTKTDYLTSTYEGFRTHFINRVNAVDFPENIYEAALLQHALQEMKGIRPGLFEFILKQQQDDGSFGGVLATYLVLPLLAGRGFLQMKDHCAQEYSKDQPPLEVLKNSKRSRINVQYSLYYGYPPEVKQTIQMRVAEGINFLDVMRLAQEINPRYRFMPDDNRDIPVVYSIGEMPNDAEKGMFWMLYVITSSNRVKSGLDRWSHFTGNIKQLIPQAHDEFAFWIKSI